MLDCWMAEPGMRPSFSELAEKIGEELSEGNKQVLCGHSVHLMLDIFLFLSALPPALSDDVSRRTSRLFKL